MLFPVSLYWRLPGYVDNILLSRLSGPATGFLLRPDFTDPVNSLTAYQLKRKNPELRRNVKFCDATLSLTMDVLVRPGVEWKTVLCDDAKAIFRKARSRVDSLSRDELEELVDDDQAGRKRRRTVDEDSSDMGEDDNDITIVEADNVDNNSKNKTYPSLTFINANARSLKPKVGSLADCFEEKEADPEW